MKLDQSIIELCKQGDRNAQKFLYVSALPYMKAVCSRYLYDTSFLKDVLQEGYINIFRNIDKFDSDKSQFKSWASRVFVNVCLNYNERIQKVYVDIDKINESQFIHLPVDVESISVDHLIILLKQMPLDYYEVFNMYVTEGYTHREIADYLGITETLSRKRLSRGREWVKRRFQNKENKFNSDSKFSIKDQE